VRIGILAGSLDKFKGGIGRYTRNLLHWLPKVSPPDFEYVVVHSRATVDLPQGVSHIAFPGLSSIPRKIMTGSLSVPYLCRRYHLDLIHDTEQLGPFFLWTPCATVLTIHDLSVTLFPDTATRTTRLYTHLLGPAARRCSRIIAVSKSTKRDLVRILNIDPHKIDVIYEASEGPLPPGDRESSIVTRIGLEAGDYILYVGYIEPRKNLLRLVDAYRILRKRYAREEKLVLVGKPLYRVHELHQHIKKSRLDDDVLMLGCVTDAELDALYANASLFVYPSLYEGFGLPVLEAMRHGCPVVTTNVSSLPEVAGEAGLLVPPNDTESIASSIENALSNGPLRKKMTARGYRRAFRFSWRRCAELTFRTYVKTVADTEEQTENNK